MTFNVKTLIQPICSGLLISLLSSFATAAIPEVKPGTPFPQLEPTREESITTQQIMSNLLRVHYESGHKRLNNDLSSEVLDTLIEDLDRNRSYFLASDVQEFERYRTTLDEALSRGYMEPAFIIYNRYQQRVSERLSFLLTELKTNASEYQFNTDETLELDREEAPWAINSKELNSLWSKRLKNSMLNLRLAGKENQAIIELLTKRYQNQLNRVHQSKASDAYETFMNAVASTFDPHTQYFSPRTSENFNINMSLSLQGIGAVLQTDDEFVKVVRLVPGGPAEQAGNLEPGDKITGVAQDNKDIVDVIGWRLDEVVDLIRGPKDSTVRLEVIPSKGSGNESKVISILRDEVKLEEQSAHKEIIEIEDNGVTRRIGVIDIPTFYIDFQGRMENKPDYRSTTRDVKRLLSELKDEAIDGLVIDLRSNGGGSLDEAVSLTGLFIQSGPVVQVRYPRGHVETLRDRDPSIMYSGPLTVLVNRLSASASEIFAGAIQDYGRGLVIGGQTFGKGTVQGLRPLAEGQLKITQAKFYRVSGNSTQNQGVIPDILFPSLFDKEKIGESSLAQAMKWDSIKPAVNMASNASIKSKVPEITKIHEERVKDNPDFIYIQEQRKLLEELRDKTEISLNETTRRHEREVNDQMALDIENTRRQAKGLPLLSSLDDEPDEPEQLNVINDSQPNMPGSEEAATIAKAEEEEVEDTDSMLVEAGHILMDYVNLKIESQLASRRR